MNDYLEQLSDLTIQKSDFIVHKNDLIIQNSDGLGHENNKYVCKICDIKTNHKSHYEKHLLTSKHIKNVKYSNTTCKNGKSAYYDCICGKSYCHRQGLSSHRKKCTYKEPDESNMIDKNIADKDIIEKDMTDKDLIMHLLKENKEFKDILMDFMKNPPQQNISTTNNTNSHNKQFNLQFFLNDTCKNAMNLSDFVNSIVIQASELEDMGKLGYVQGISNIMIRSLKELDETERPFHCTDKKREVIYIKENNVWEKETSDRAKLYQFVKDIAYRNFKRMPQWEKDNPKYDDITTKKHLEYIRMLNQVMTGLGPEELGVNKIIRNLSAHVYLDK